MACWRLAWWPLRRPLHRALASSGSRKPWAAMSQTERAAWEALGHGEAWHQKPQKPLPRWGELQAHQQAAAKHGLGHDKAAESHVIYSAIEL